MKTVQCDTCEVTESTNNFGDAPEGWITVARSGDGYYHVCSLACMVGLAIRFVGGDPSEELGIHTQCPYCERDLD